MLGPMAHARLLDMIVRTAANVLRARAGSLLLIDEAHQELVFEASATEEVSKLKSIRVPLGQGIAGLVAVTGQPMAVTDTQEDPRHAAEIAQRTGYLPRSLLCVPLSYDGAVIGVLELLDKEGAAQFEAADMHTLSLFANLAAVAIEQSRAQRSLSALLRQLLASLGEKPLPAQERLLQRVSTFAADLESDPAFQRTIQLARLVHEIAENGDGEAELCLTVLRGIADYVRGRKQLLGRGLTHG